MTCSTCFLIYVYNIYVYVCMCHMYTDSRKVKKTASDPLDLLLPSGRYWELNLGPLEQQEVLVTTEQSLQLI